MIRDKAGTPGTWDITPITYTEPFIAPKYYNVLVFLSTRMSNISVPSYSTGKLAATKETRIIEHSGLIYITLRKVICA